MLEQCRRSGASLPGCAGHCINPNMCTVDAGGSSAAGHGTLTVLPIQDCSFQRGATVHRAAVHVYGSLVISPADSPGS